MTVEILRPAEGESFHVVLEGTGGTGYICARGSADHPLSPGARAANPVEARAYARVVPRKIDENAPEVHAGPTGWPSVPVVDDRWFFPKLSGAVCSARRPFPTNTLIVWAVFSDATGPVVGLAHFEGQCADHVECNGGSGSGSHGVVPTPCEGEAGVPVELAPAQWSFRVEGMPPGKAEVFNGAWLLTLRPALGGDCVWDNGADGEQAVRVELRCEAPLARCFRLTFRDRRAGEVCYLAPASRWAPVAPNWLALAPGAPADLGKLPPSILVAPA
jgi:hypothetical protein